MHNCCVGLVILRESGFSWFRHSNVPCLPVPSHLSLLPRVRVVVRSRATRLPFMSLCHSPPDHFSSGAFGFVVRPQGHKGLSLWRLGLQKLQQQQRHLTFYKKNLMAFRMKVILDTPELKKKVLMRKSTLYRVCQKNLTHL